ncbi:uncharacterized protein with von Willebrand factor type A (vWA) domain [Nocardiopsis mwathae]|uniref:Uncharacterized protein with von Willebrand factor type A (VWA) domain n=1 Tax=Nocardiopsis mwathae TaxID=1472723 RepID=A0A7W9YJS9_9ACTN|nr:hypothetical protein [Nocardiopsis mwathae]MBB6173470.1 uncharacterized protein with von Willebrand factor type A (vWA) domain [Nocardiopsis mwathae]
MDRVRYAAYQGGPDPLAPPVNPRAALDELGRGVLAGARPADALRELLRHGAGGDGPPAAPDGFGAGLAELRRRVRERIGQIRSGGVPDGWFADLPPIPDRPSGHRSQPTAPERIPEPDVERVHAMLTALNALLVTGGPGHPSAADFDRFMAEHGDFFPEGPRDLGGVVDALARRAAAAQRMLDSLAPEDRAELTALADRAIAAAGLGPGLELLADTLRSRRPGLSWSGTGPMHGLDALGLVEAASAVRKLADLGELDAALGQDYPGADLADIDDEAVLRALGPDAADTVARLRSLERGLREAGYLDGPKNRVRLTPRALRRLGETALRDVLADTPPRLLRPGGHGGADRPGAPPVGAAGEPTGRALPAEPGDERPVDVVRTLGNAVARGRSARGGSLRVHPQDIEVAECEQGTAAAVCLLVDLSYSMVRRGLWAAVKRTSMALHTLVATHYPQDALRVIGFDDRAREIPGRDLAELGPNRVQGTNLQHALALAGRHLDTHPDFAPIVVVVTDGEPTAHIARDGSPAFCWPPSAETTAATLAEVDRMTRRGARLHTVLLTDDPRLRAFADQVAHRNGGTVVRPDPAVFGTRVIRDFLTRRRALP